MEWLAADGGVEGLVLWLVLLVWPSLARAEGCSNTSVDPNLRSNDSVVEPWPAVRKTLVLCCKYPHSIGRKQLLSSLSLQLQVALHLYKPSAVLWYLTPATPPRPATESIHRKAKRATPSTRKIPSLANRAAESKTGCPGLVQRGVHPKRSLAQAPPTVGSQCSASEASGMVGLGWAEVGRRLCFQVVPALCRLL